MSLAIEFHPDAADEAVAAHDWYREIDAKLGTDFANELERALDRIAAAPERGTRYLHGTRCFLFERFSYLIIYVHAQVKIQIIAIQHAKRRPGHWKERLN